jgi:oligopeptide transport system substrate-binding protein
MTRILGSGFQACIVRPMRTPLFRPAVMVAAGLLALAGCARRETPVQEGLRTRTLHLGNSQEPGDLDPQIITTYTENMIVLALFEGLAAFDEASGQPVPAAAESWSVSPDGLTYTFRLRPTARWSNGDPLTAADFVWSYRRVLSPALASEYSYMLWPIKNARAFNEGKLTDFAQVGVRATDERTLVLTLEAPCPWLLSLTANPSWFPVHPATLDKFGAADKKGTRWTRPENLVGNGPFLLKEWTPDSRVVTEANPRYWDAGRNKLAGVVFYPITSYATEEKSFRSGQLHITYGLAPDKIPVYRTESPGQLRIDPFLETFFLSFNTAKPPLDNARLRQALSLAIDRTAVTRDALRGSVTVATEFTPPDTAGYTPAPALKTDFAAARQLLAEAGYPGGRGLPPLELQVKADELHKITAETIQQMWQRELGVTVTLAIVEQKTWLQRLNSRDFQISTTRWVGDYVDANTFLEMWVTGGGNNWSGWSEPRYDALVAEAGKTLDPVKRHDLQRQAEALLLDRLPILPVFHGTRVYLADPNVKNWVPNLLGQHRYQFIELKK